MVLVQVFLLYICDKSLLNYQFDGNLFIGLDVLPTVKHTEGALTDILTEPELLANT
jgi:hypothetical protein